MKLSPTVTQDNAFALSSLPLTMELANKTKSILLPKIKNIPIKWPYEDRILVWLGPSFFEYVNNYHSGAEKGLMQLLNLHQVEHLDQTFLKNLLSKFRKIRPGIIRINT
jgi:hypothetical protein